ncbi:aminodeoxychorismate/anthranilate synthase component II [Kamptonema cortianum]|nr:aminodeoxychorismate/anthranilate synthase component II [Geitlerinema splendidum]MDK3156859.1 aminodeoxychorismate/anthranilate synthase component II [Kamptonema cortianum]
MVLVIDNYDSFTYNLVQYLAQCDAEVVVKRNDEITLAEIVTLMPKGILLSPGPCTPKESGICRDVTSMALDPQGPLAGIPIFGVCLGHQTFGDVSGAVVRRAKTIMHGKTSEIEHDGKGLLAGLPNPATVVRYHSLVVDEDSLGDEWLVTARSLDDNEIMGMRHKNLPIEGVQFHPESILTESGMQIVRNFTQLL